MTKRIVKLTVANIKRIKAISIEPTRAVVTVGGKNQQGKTSTLDAIAMALGIPSAHNARVIAVAARCDPRTVMSAYRWLPVGQLTYERILASVERLGFADVHPLPPRTRTKQEMPQHRTLTGPELLAAANSAKGGDK